MGVKWRDPEVQALCGFLFRIVGVFFTGFYAWYFVLTLPKVEWALLTRRMKLTWSHISYFIARYCHLATMLTIIITSNVNQILLTCDTVLALKATAALGNVALAAASTNLGLRALVMWRDVRPVMFGLCAVFVVHGIFALVMGLESVQLRWDPSHRFCIVATAKSQTELLAFYTFTLTWDITILCFTLLGMRRQRLPATSALWGTLFSQGFGYFAISCFTCISMVVMVLLNLNNTMNVLLTAPGGTISVIASSAFVTSLLEMKEPDPSSPSSRPASPSRETPRKPDAGVSHALTTHIELYESQFRNSCELADDEADDADADGALDKRTSARSSTFYAEEA